MKPGNVYVPIPVESAREAGPLASWDPMDWEKPWPHFTIAHRMMLGWVQPTAVTVGNPYDRPTRFFIGAGQTNPFYRTYLEHTWVILDAHVKRGRCR